MCECVCVCVCLCVHRGLISENFPSVRQWVPYKSSPLLIAFPSDSGGRAMATLAFRFFRYVSSYGGKMVRPGKTPREDKKNKDIRDLHKELNFYHPLEND